MASEPEKIYVVVTHIPSGRAYGLGRHYGCVRREMSEEDYESLGDFTEKWKAWGGGHDLPEWAQDIPEEETIAKWYSID